MTRIVIVSHSHPALRYGGGEVAAYRQFQHLLAQGQDVYFVGSTIGPEDGARFSAPASASWASPTAISACAGWGWTAFRWSIRVLRTRTGPSIS